MHTDTIFVIILINYGHARISTINQHIDRQIEALLKSGIKKENIYIDYEFGKDFNRNYYKELIKNNKKR